MIYVGYIHLDEITTFTGEGFITALNSIVDTNPKIIRKKSVTLGYGKILADQDMDEIWQSDTSLLMGRIFDKANQSSFSEKKFKHCAHLPNKEFLEKIWGKYVYINVDTHKPSVDIILDMTGQLPFFYYPFPNGSVLFSSHAEIISNTLSQKIGHRLEYNLEYLCSYLIYGNSSSIQTPFKGVYEVPPGCHLKITKASKTTIPFWDPTLACKGSSLDKKGNNAIDVLQSTLKPWIAPYKNVCVSLSGGLDSSSLVYCLKDIVREDQTLKALNYFHSQIKSSNELYHARNVCKETDIELIEVDVSASLPFDPPRNKSPLKLNKPFPGLVSQKWLETTCDYVCSEASTVFLSGHGSDHIFMRPPSKKSLADYVIEKGFKGSKQKLHEVTHFYRDSLFSIIKENLSSLFLYTCKIHRKKRGISNANDEVPKWIKPALIKQISSQFVHPVYDCLPRNILPGKYEQIDALYEGIASIHVECMNQNDPMYYPFLYEPVVEFALSFSTYKLFDKGYDRYPLRQAVSDRFRTETVWRRDKGQTTGVFQLGVKRNLEYILETCLEGYFVKNGLIDREGLYKTIRLIANGDIKHFWPFLHLISAEIFLKSWEKRT